MKRMQTAVLLMGMATLGSAWAGAQTKQAGGLSRTDVGLSVYGAFSGTTTGNGVIQSPSNAAGGLIEVRHIVNPIYGFEGTYAYNRANQVYTGQVLPLACPAPQCGISPAAISANAHEVTGDWIASLKIANLRPFALAGGGLLLNVPASGQANTSTSTKGVFAYGAGVDWGLLPHIGLRFQYRGNLYQAPNLSQLFTSSGRFTHTAEPMIGIFLRL